MAPTIGVLLASVTVPVMTPFGTAVGVTGLRVGPMPAGELETDGCAVVPDVHAATNTAHATVKARSNSLDMPTIPEYAATLAPITSAKTELTAAVTPLVVVGRYLAAPPHRRPMGPVANPVPASSPRRSRPNRSATAPAATWEAAAGRPARTPRAAAGQPRQLADQDLCQRGIAAPQKIYWQS